METVPKAPLALFSYGTLRDEQVQLAVFGRRLRETADALTGFTRHEIELEDPDTGARAVYPILQPAEHPTPAIAGAALEVSSEDLAHADLYEGPAYRRILVELKSGRRAFAYVAAELRDTRIS